jgi:hypothetical protein
VKLVKAIKRNLLRKMWGNLENYIEEKLVGTE